MKKFQFIISKTKAMAFSMVEILVSLTIIGLVAAIIVPSLHGNSNEKIWNAQRMALYSRMTQAFSLLRDINGYGITTEGNKEVVDEDNAALIFITEVLSTVYKMSNVCDNEHFFDCGFPAEIGRASWPKAPYSYRVPSTSSSTKADNDSKVKIPWPTTMYDLVYSWEHLGNDFYNINVKAAAFETLGGESIAVYYNPKCVEIELDRETNYYPYAQETICVNLVYDLNGRKGPNVSGKDIGFISAFYPHKPVVVMPILSERQYKRTIDRFKKEEFFNKCTALDHNSRVTTLPEAASLMINQNISSAYFVNAEHWTTTKSPSGKYWQQRFDTGLSRGDEINPNIYVTCIKR